MKIISLDKHSITVCRFIMKYNRSNYNSYDLKHFLFLNDYREGRLVPGFRRASVVSTGVIRASVVSISLISTSLESGSLRHITPSKRDLIYHYKRD